MRVYYGRKARRSGRLLSRALRNMDGESINFGYQRAGIINPAPAVALASNKRLALLAMRDAGVPTPEILLIGERIDHYRNGTLIVPIVGRPDKHRGGSNFYLCWTAQDYNQALVEGATHFTQYIENGREFRVHVAFGKSIKLAEKIGGDPLIRNFSHGSKFMYPDFNHKKTLRKVARQAVMSLGLDFGAVDVIYKDDKYYVLEVNTSPSLTSDSDILDRYVRAFKERAEERE